MGAINGRLRRNRRNRLAAELQCTWTPRRLFTFGTSVGGAHWFTDPNTLYRRRNRLTYTRDFSNAAWTKTNILSTTSDADGVGDLVVPNTTNATHNVSQAGVAYSAGNVMRVRAKAGGYNFIAIRIGLDAYAHFNVSAGTVGTLSGATGAIAAAADAPGYYDCTCVTTSAVAGANALIYVAAVDGVLTFAGDGTSGVYLARAQLEWNTTTPTEYQDVPTTWPQAYLDAVGAENIYAWVDKAGTTPVTAVGDTIGLSLDRAYGGARGVELVTNGDFASDTWWTKGTDWVISGGVASRGVSASFSNLSRPALLTVGKTYQIQLDIVAISGTVTVLCGGGSSISFTTTGRKSTILTCSGDAAFYIQASGGAVTCTIDNVSIREIPGTHLIQATGTARPTLSARVNRLAYTEQFDNAYWTKNAQATVTANQAVAPDGNTTADLWVAASGGNNAIEVGVTSVNGSPSTAEMRASVALKYVSGSVWVQLTWSDGSANQCRAWFNVQTGVVGTSSAIGTATVTATPTVTPLGNGWYRLTIQGTQPVTMGYFIVTCRDADNSTTQAAGSFYIWGADLRTADDAAKNIPSYQRVGATAADHDTAGFPHYLLYDGTDDSMASAATVDGSATDKVTVVTGVTKNSDVALGIVAELSATIGGNNGAFAVYAPTGAAGANFAALSRGTTLRTATTSAAYAAPSSKVLTLAGDISGNSVAARVNSVADGSDTGDQGTGNYGNYTLYWGSRGGLSIRFNGREYASIGRFGPMSDTERNRLESWVKNLMRLP